MAESDKKKPTRTVKSSKSTRAAKAPNEENKDEQGSSLEINMESVEITEDKVVQPKLTERESQLVIVRRLIERGRKSGTLTEKEVLDELQEIDLNPEQIDKIYETLEGFSI